MGVLVLAQHGRPSVHIWAELGRPLQALPVCLRLYSLLSARAMPGHFPLQHGASFVSIELGFQG